MQRMFTTLRPWTRASPFVLTQQKIDAYAVQLAEFGRAPLTVETYKRWLETLQKLLPGGKVTPETPLKLQHRLLGLGYAPRSVNVALTALNGLLKSHNLWLPPLRLEEPPTTTPELTAEEVARLLSAARTLGDERAYLMISVCATLGLTPKELPQLTVEAVKSGKIGETAKISSELAQELLRYAERIGRRTGPVFVDGAGQPLHRSLVTRLVQHAAEAARVDRDKATPRSLHKFYVENVARLHKGIEKSYEMEAKVSC